jgi:cell division protein FtsN
VLNSIIRFAEEFMPSFERGVYEPKSDDIRVFDEDEQEIDEEGSRLPLLIVIALLVLAAFGGVVWLAYNQGVQRGRSDAPRMIVAAPGPVKEAAANTDTTHNLKIYQQPAPSDDEAAESDNVPPQPTETAKPAPSSPMVAKPEAKPAAPKPSLTTTVKPAPKPEATAMRTGETKPVESKPAVTKPAVAAKPVETAALPPPPTASKPAPAAPTAAAASGAYVLQIGAYKSQDEADAAWKSFTAKHPIAGGYSEDVRRADLGDKGIWYRLRMGSFADKSAAAAFCDKLKADGGNCLIAK